jgi:hypothetical protein
MAEFVRDGIDGLHFWSGDSADLALRMGEAMEPELWERLVAGIVPPRRMVDAADEHLALYSRLLADAPLIEESARPRVRAGRRRAVAA